MKSARTTMSLGLALLAVATAFAPAQRSAPRCNALRADVIDVSETAVVEEAPTAAAWRAACDASGVTSYADFGVALGAPAAPAPAAPAAAKWAWSGPVFA